jgi:hypothetical protein
VVANAYTPPATSYADNGDALTHYGRSWQPEQTSCLDALREIAEAVYGQFFIARDGTPTYLSRDDRQDSSVSAAVTLGDVAYWQRVKMMQPYHLVGYWRLNESSGTSAGDSSGSGHGGTASGVSWGEDGIGDGDTAAGFDGVNDYVDVYSAGLAGAFDGGAGTVSIWFHVRDAGVWTDGTNPYLVNITADSANRVELRKLASTQTLFVRYRAGGVDKVVYLPSLSDVDYHHLVLTWDKAADEAKVYLDGGQVGSTLTGLGTWAGSPAAMMVGAAGVCSGCWNGMLAHAALWDVALTPGEIAQMAGV